MDISKIQLPDNTILNLKDGRMGNAKIFHGTCSSEGSATAKVVTCADFTSENLVTGALIFVTFTATNSGAVASLTMDVNSTGAKSIKKQGNASSTNNLANAGELRANSTYLFQYDGTNWVCMTLDYNSTYSALSEADMQAGTATTGRTISAARLKQAVEYWMAENQADWNETDTDSPSYIANKPTLSSNIFFADYGVTTVAEVRAALTAGKLVYCVFNGMPYAAGVDDGVHIYFYSIDPDNHTLYKLDFSPGGWYNSSEAMPTMNPGTLNTTATTAQSTSASESLSGTINLHKVSKTGSYSDLRNRPLFDRAWNLDVSGTEWQVRQINITFAYSGNYQCVYLVEAHSGNSEDHIDFSALVKFDWIGSPAECDVISGSISTFSKFYNSNNDSYFYGLSIDFSSLSYFEGIIQITRLTNTNATSWDENINVQTAQTYPFPAAGTPQVVKYLYSKPSSGIPASDLASAVQTSLGKADSALQSYTETDPAFSASAAAGITSGDITNWNNKVSNVQSDWNATTGLAAILNKPTIPAAVTESTVSGWGFTKNTGTYSKPSGGIPASDLASGVIPTVPSNVSAFTNDANYVKYALCADEAAYSAIANKDSGTLYLIPEEE